MADATTKLIDVTRLAARLLEDKHPTGVDRVGLAYIRQYRHAARALVRHRGRWLRLYERPSRRLFEALLGEDSWPKLTVRASVAQTHLWNLWHCGGCVFFNTGHSGLDHPDYAAAVRRQGVRPVYFLHDLIPVTHPEFSRQEEDEKHHKRLQTMLETACGLVLNSADTQRDLLAYLEQHGYATPPHIVAPLGLEALPEAERRPPLDEPYFVMLGTLEPRKNHLLMLHIWRRLVERSVGPVPRLVLIGQRGWECEQVIDLLERSVALRKVVLELPRCPDAELATWLKHAQALLFPSFVEGFGLPLIEALSLGTPVIASDLDVFREVAGAVPEYIDPLDGPAWMRAVQAYQEHDNARRQAQIRRLQGFRPSSWADHFRRVDAFIARHAPAGRACTAHEHKS